MPLQLNVSNDLNVLAEKLSAAMRNEGSVFRPVPVVTQTEGMNNWLKLQIASYNGIAANMTFFKPNDIIYEIYFVLGGEFESPVSVYDLQWVIFQILGRQQFRSLFPEIAGYYQADVETNDLRRFALAAQVADLFDQYQVYRSSMVDRWIRQAPATAQAATEAWQQYIWREIHALIGKRAPDKTKLKEFIVAALELPEKRELLRDRLPEIHLFGLSLMTAYHLSIFNAVGRWIDISYFILNPSPLIYWFDDKSEKTWQWLRAKGWVDPAEKPLGNPLLTSWGRLIQDTFSLLFHDEQWLNSYEALPGEAPLTDSLLHRLQHAFYHNTKHIISPVTDEALCDGSLRVASCYSPAREVEALYDYLVGIVSNAKTGCSPREIIVMVSDIDLYASYIKAVFDHAPYRFPYAIADESYAQADSLANALITLLKLGEHPFSVGDVLQFLDYSIIRDRFQLDRIDWIRTVVESANIRFGISGAEADGSQYVSWEYGLRRMMFGLCMRGEAEVGEGADSFFPVDRVEGFAMYPVVRFVYFVRLLIRFIRERKAPRTVPQWVAFITDWIDHLFAPADVSQPEWEESYLLIAESLQRYNTLVAELKDPVAYEVFLHSFLPLLSDTRRSNAFTSGGITFCSLIPMRSIPFQVVAMLGMDFDKFPRKSTPLSFDLMQGKRQKGDRNVKDNDKHLFLETVLSAGSFLYLSYVGQNDRDNSEFPASALVDELLDYIEQNAETPDLVRPRLVIRHPLHSFSNRYNQGDKRLVSYLSRSIPPAPLKVNQDAATIPELQTIGLDQLIRFLKNPVKGYYNDVLQVFLDRKEYQIRETELFELDTLQQWWLKSKLLETTPDEATSFINEQVKKGLLPLKNMATAWVGLVGEKIDMVKALFEQKSQGFSERSLSVQVTFDSCTLQGEIRNIYGSSVVDVAFSKGDLKHLFASMVRCLMLCASGQRFSYFYISSRKEDVFTAATVPAREAQQMLHDCVQLYQSGHSRLIPLTMEMIEKDKGGGSGTSKNDPESRLNKLDKSGDIYWAKARGQNLITTACLPEFDAMSEKVTRLVRRVFPDYFNA